MNGSQDELYDEVSLLRAENQRLTEQNAKLIALLRRIDTRINPDEETNARLTDVELIGSMEASFAETEETK